MKPTGIKKTIKEQIKDFFHILHLCICCLDIDGKEDEDVKEPMTRVKLGYRGKDIWIETFGINFHQTFGKFAILLDQDDQVVPINSNGELFEPLDPQKKYKVEINRFGSSDEKWKQFNKQEREKRKEKFKFKKNNKNSIIINSANINKNNNNNNNNINDSSSSSSNECEMNIFNDNSNIQENLVNSDISDVEPLSINNDNDNDNEFHDKILNTEPNIENIIKELSKDDIITSGNSNSNSNNSNININNSNVNSNNSNILDL